MNESICRVGLSVFEEHARSSKDNRTYLAGLDFISKERDQPNKTFGYRIPGKLFYIDIESWNDVQGFELVTGAKGIHAIRIHHAQVSHWVGSLKADEPTTKILVSDRQIVGLWGKFDVSRLPLPYCYMWSTDTFSLAL
jgi:hypothetical protein